MLARKMEWNIFSYSGVRIGLCSKCGLSYPESLICLDLQWFCTQIIYCRCQFTVSYRLLIIIAFKSVICILLFITTCDSRIFHRLEKIEKKIDINSGTYVFIILNLLTHLNSIRLRNLSVSYSDSIAFLNYQLRTKLQGKHRDWENGFHLWGHLYVRCRKYLYWWESQKERDHFENQHVQVGGWIILELILEREDGVVWTGLIDLT
jgi:hypothetical protein